MALSVFSSAESYYSGPEEMKNEVGVWFVAAGILFQEVSRKSGNSPFGGLGIKVGYEEHDRFPEIEILDLCSGPGNFVNHLSLVYPKLKAICVDSNEVFVRDGSNQFPKWQFILGDASSIHLHRKFQYISVSSGYHHITDREKPLLMRNIAANLADNGMVLVCENLLPFYKDEAERADAVNLFYDEFQKCKATKDITEHASSLLEEVRHSDLRKDDERKVSFEIFRGHVKAAKLKIDMDVAVWQPEALKKDNAGTHLFVLRNV